MIDSVIVDASPFIILARSSLTDIIPKLFDSVLIVDAVWDEIMAGPDSDAARNLLPQLTWLERRTIRQIAPRLSNLGKGEAESITLALEAARAAVLTDDHAARKSAHALEVPYLGTGRLLVEAHRRGFVSSLDEALSAVRSNGLWISDSVVAALLEKAAS